jgi:hypothetical protein
MRSSPNLAATGAAEEIPDEIGGPFQGPGL